MPGYAFMVLKRPELCAEKIGKLATGSQMQSNHSLYNNYVQKPGLRGGVCNPSFWDGTV